MYSANQPLLNGHTFDLFKIIQSIIYNGTMKGVDMHRPLEKIYKFLFCGEYSYIVQMQSVSPCSSHDIIFLGLLIDRTTHSTILHWALPCQFPLFLYQRGKRREMKSAVWMIYYLSEIKCICCWWYYTGYWNTVKYILRFSQENVK